MADATTLEVTGEHHELAAFLQRIRRAWRGSSPGNRALLRRQFEEAVGGTVSSIAWKQQYEALLERYDRALEAEAGRANRALARVMKLHWDAGNRKTIRTADLKAALDGPPPEARAGLEPQ